MANFTDKWMEAEPKAEFIITDDHSEKLILRLSPEEHEDLSDVVERDGDNWVAKPGREQEFNILLYGYMTQAHDAWVKNGGRRREILKRPTGIEVKPHE